MEKNINKELRISRDFKVPIDLMWKVWTQPEHIVHWWGPDGFTNTIQKMDFRKDGEWNLTMHGPNGINFPNRSIFREIIPLKKIVFEHFNPHFITTVHFESKDHETRIEWSLRFDTAEMYETIIKVHKADVAQKQNLDRLETFFEKLKNSSEV